MSTHLTDKEIDNYVAGLASPKDAEKAAGHIDLCRQCRENFGILLSAVAARPSDSVPGERVREALIAEWHLINNEAVIKNKRSKLPVRRLIGGLAFAASAVIAVSAYLFFNTLEFDTGYPLVVSSVSGEVNLNDSKAVIKSPLYSGEVITTGDDASVTVSADGYDLYIGRSSSLEVAENRKGEAIRFKLREGFVMSKSYGDVHYSFECGSFLVIPSGTEFFLKFSDGKLDAAVSRGGIVIKSSGLRIEIPAGMMWSSGHPDIVKPVDDESALLLNNTLPEVNPDKGVSPPDKAKDHEKKSGESPPEDKSGTLNENGSNGEDEADRREKIKIKREILEEMNEIKREQRREKKGKSMD